MDRTSPRALATVAVLVLAGAAALLGRAPTFGAPAAGRPDTAAISATERAAGPRFAAGVPAADRAWMLASIGVARPEAQRLIAEIDGLIEFRTHAGDPLGVTRTNVGAAGSSFVIDVDTASLNGRRVQDRDVTMLHELGHAIDHAIVPAATNAVLEAGIPRSGSCDAGATGLVGSCATPEERIADTFAKWALRGNVSAVGAGYEVATPPSLEQWGAPLAALAGELPG